MSLSPFDSFQSRFVTYLLNCRRTTAYVILLKVVYLRAPKQQDEPYEIKHYKLFWCKSKEGLPLFK
jgi:hypothetical protein